MKPKIDYRALLETRRFNDATDCEQEKEHFLINDSVIGTAGNFVNLVGLPKAGKSTFLSAIIASAISRKIVFDFKLFLHPGSGRGRICLFDTEQSSYDFNKTIRRIKTLAGVRDIYKNFDCFTVREDYSNEILKMIYTYLKETPQCEILVIDGLLDLIDNFNDESASKTLIKYLRRWSKQFNCLIITVLHLGKKDGHSLGHLGSFADRYAQSTLIIEKTKQGTFACAPRFLRSGRDFTPIEIIYNELTKSYRQV